MHGGSTTVEEDRELPAEPVHIDLIQRNVAEDGVLMKDFLWWGQLLILARALLFSV